SSWSRSRHEANVSFRSGVTFARNASNSAASTGPSSSPSANFNVLVPRPTCTAATRSFLGTVPSPGLSPAVIVYGTTHAARPNARARAPARHTHAGMVYHQGAALQRRGGEQGLQVIGDLRV